MVCFSHQTELMRMSSFTPSLHKTWIRNVIDKTHSFNEDMVTSILDFVHPYYIWRLISHLATDISFNFNWDLKMIYK